MSSTEAKLDLAPDGRPTTFHRGDRLGKFQIQAFIARGGMGEVYKAWDTDLNRSVAVKTLLVQSGAYASDPQFRERFRQEARTISHLEHENVVRVLDLGEHEGLPFIVMPYLDGQDLQKRLSAAKSLPLTTEEAVEILLGACRGVDMCHRAGVIHRDLKPGNIFLTTDQETGRRLVKVLDFGVAKPRVTDGSEFTLDGLVLGTPGYMPPEQARGLPVDAKSDQYALGALLYSCLTLHKPYSHVEAGLASREERGPAVLRALREGRGFPAPRSYVPEIPDLLEAVILRAMASNPDDRFPSVLDFSRELLPYASEGVRMYLHAYYNATPRSIAPPQLSTTLRLSDLQALSSVSLSRPGIRDPELPTTKSLRPPVDGGKAAANDSTVSNSHEAPTESNATAGTSVLVPDASLVPATETTRDVPRRRPWATALLVGASIAVAIFTVRLVIQLSPGLVHGPAAPRSASVVVPTAPPAPRPEPASVPIVVPPVEASPLPPAAASRGPGDHEEANVSPRKPDPAPRRIPASRKRSRTGPPLFAD